MALSKIEGSPLLDAILNPSKMAAGLTEGEDMKSVAREEENQIRKIVSPTVLERMERECNEAQRQAISAAVVRCADSSSPGFVLIQVRRWHGDRLQRYAHWLTLVSGTTRDGKDDHDRPVGASAAK